MMILVSNFILHFKNFVSKIVCLTKLLTLGLLFLPAVRTVVVAMYVKSGILSLIFSILALHISFLTTLFLLHHLVYLN